MLLNSVFISMDDIRIEIEKALNERLKPAEHILDGVSLEELVNYDIPPLSSEVESGVILSYRDGKIVKNEVLNGGVF
jgi:hypothetical protein